MQYVTGIHAKPVYTRLSWQNLLASIPCNSRGIFHSIDQSGYHPGLDLGMQCSPLQLIPLSWIVCFLILALIGHLCAFQDNPSNHHFIVIRVEMVGIPHRNRDTLWKSPPHKQNPELVAGGAQSLQSFYCDLQMCNLGTTYLQLRVGLRSSYTHNDSPPDQDMTGNSTASAPTLL